MMIPIDAIVLDDMDYGLFEDTEIIQNSQPMNTCGGIEVVGVETNLNYDLLSNETVIDYKSKTGERKIDLQPSIGNGPDPDFLVNDYVIVKCVLTDQYFPGQIVDKSELSYTISRWVRIGRSQRWFCPPNRDITCKKEREYIIKKMSPPTETADKGLYLIPEMNNFNN
ncbi:hypothetical protein J6590_074289 [Homalodisca vitripennis]|nr:hypothetical protein J6590_074289 [Homalodisca vitripennis]